MPVWQDASAALSDFLRYGDGTLDLVVERAAFNEAKLTGKYLFHPSIDEEPAMLEYTHPLGTVYISTRKVAEEGWITRPEDANVDWTRQTPRRNTPTVVTGNRNVTMLRDDPEDVPEDEPERPRMGGLIEFIRNTPTADVGRQFNWMTDEIVPYEENRIATGADIAERG